MDCGSSSKIAEAWQGWELRPHGFIDLGGRVLWLGTQRALGGASQIPIEDPYAQLQDIDRGLISRQQAFNDWDAALRAGGGCTATRCWASRRLAHLTATRSRRPP